MFKGSSFKVNILPIRNGNYPVMSEMIWNFGLVNILPIRNGNTFLFFLTKSTTFVNILPIRNGNFTNSNE